ncbi:MAG: LacI family DNA-binding transcriptional regulator [Cyclobacteriaceae bacterium]|nr:LacI family DNA-binding transcriptional regulator [Cyclobacteriaceae bacterium]
MTHYKEVTIYDIAEVLKVSPATVSRGLKDHPGIRKDTKRKIVDTAKKMGYQHNTFASNLRRKKTNTIGVIVPRIESHFHSLVISGIEKVANTMGYNLIISQSQELFKNEVNSIATMFNSRIDGLLISLSNETKSTDHLEMLLRKKIPLIFFDRVIEHPDCTRVVIDNKKAGYDATQHLLKQGCKRIVHMDGPINRNVYADRLEGYKQALQEVNINFDSSLVINIELTDKAAAIAAQQILKMQPLPDGIFTANDISAVSCIRELKRAGIRIPDDIAVVGFNNEPIATVIEPNLTTIGYPGREMGEIAASTLINKLNKTNVTNLNTIVLRHELIIRQSSQKKK